MTGGVGVADGVRAGPRPDRGPGAQRAGRQRSSRSPRSRPPSSSAPASSAWSAPRTTTGRTGTRSSTSTSAALPSPLAREDWRSRSGPRRVRGRQLRPAHRRRRRSCPRSASTRCAAAATSRCWPAARRPPRTRSRSARRRCARSTRRLGQTVRVTVNQVSTRPWSGQHARDARRRRRRAPRVQPGQLHPHRPGHRRGACPPALLSEPTARRPRCTGRTPATTSSCCGTGPAPTWPPRRAHDHAGPPSNGCPVGSCMVPSSPISGPATSRTTPSIRDTPLVLAVVLAVLAVGTLAHVLLTGVRRRRRDLARAQDPRLHQAAGARARSPGRPAPSPPPRCSSGCRSASSPDAGPGPLFAGAAGVSTAATVPLATVLLAIPATLLAANLIAAAPGWDAARLRPALVLRTE